MPRPKKSSKPVNKTAWVRSLPESMSAREVSEKAKAQGMAITPGYVYEIRSSAKRKTNGRTPTPTASPDAAFRRMVIDLGLARAKALLLEVERALAALTR